MSVTIISTANTTGVRRLSTLSGLGSVPDPSTIQELENNGYDPGTVNTLVALGATNDQLLALPYPAGSDEMAAAVSNLMNQLGGGTPTPGAPASSAPSYPQSAQPTTISTAFGPFDLLQQSSWDAINGLFVGAAQQLNTLAAKNPKDPDLPGMVSEFNAYVSQWANYYQQAVGQSPSPSAQVVVTLGTLGIAPLIIVGIVAGVAALIATLYGFITGKLAQKAQAAAAVQTAQTQASLAAQYQAAVKANNTQLAAQIAAMMTATGTPPPGQPTNWSAWFQTNFGLILAALIGIAIVPPLLKRR